MNNHLYRILAGKVGAYHRCAQTGNTEWEAKHKEAIESLVEEHAPSGSGFDQGTHIVIDDSTEEKLVFTTAFHHMNEHGGYDGWTHHTVTVRPSLAHEYKLFLGGRNRSGIKEYISENFGMFLSTILP